MPVWRTSWTSTVDDRRASRLTSLSMRDMSSAEWVPLKKARGMSWMCRNRSRRSRAITRCPTEAMRYHCK